MQAKVPAQERQRTLAENFFLSGTPEASATSEKKMNQGGRIVKEAPDRVLSSRRRGLRDSMTAFPFNRAGSRRLEQGRK